MVLNIIMAVSMIPVVWIVYYMERQEGTPKNGCLFAVKISKEKLETEEVKAIRERYRHRVNSFLGLLIVGPVVPFLIPYTSVQITVWMLWLCSICFGMMIPFAMGNRELQTLKQKQGWEQAEAEGEAGTRCRYVELTDPGRVRRVHGWQFLIPILMAAGCIVVPLLYDYQGMTEVVLIMEIVYASMVLLFMGLAFWVDRTRVEVISEDSTVNVNYGRGQRKIWRDFWLTLEGLTVLAQICILFLPILTEDVSGVSLWVTIFYSLLTVVAALRMYNRFRKIRDIYNVRVRHSVVPGDDSNWHLGLIYNNPNDKKTLVPKRSGTGSTINVATTGGKVWAGLGAIAILSIPILCIWCMVLEFTPIQLKYENGELIARHTGEKYRIEAEQMEAVEILTELPRMSKSVGTAMDNIYIGSFNESGAGKVHVFLNPKNTQFIRFTYRGKEYIFSGRTDEETLAVMDALGL